MQAWNDFVTKQEEKLGKEIAEKWLCTLKVVHFDSGNLYLEAKDLFQIQWFEEHIRPKIKSELLNNNFRPIKVHLNLATPQEESAKIKKEKKTHSSQIHFLPDKLDPAMTLENFVSGEINRVVFELFCELTGYDLNTQDLKNPKIPLAAFNPIYLWGGAGSGKTHLLMALAHTFKKKGLNALYVRTETFTEHVVDAIRNSEMQSFRQAYRNADILLIDDVHLLARKNATQEELFHTFNTLHSSGRQLILSSKCAPALLEDIEPRLVSRFEWGMTLHFQKLESKDLRQVLLKRCEALHFPLSEEVIAFLTHTFLSTKTLHLALEALVLRSHLSPTVIDLAAAKKILSDLIEKELEIALSPEKIIAAVSSKYGIRREDLLGKSQTQECSFSRQIAMYLCREELKLPFQGIGRIFARDHSTVMTSIKQIKEKLDKADPEILTSLAEIRSALEIYPNNLKLWPPCSVKALAVRQSQADQY